ncbi:50S ribosomal protein L2 [Thelohanellus kitauei]|uniref:50S ribosomal protein L2 n=1 Tax=Thelohanellus kitauei TaxID=669202 RepID=A0A0C2N0X6_THEKT|nr:50S ribosomal protein L2 [Thelohanellus kitauei]
MITKFYNFVRTYLTSQVTLTRTEWSMNRVKVRQPTCHIPRYLLDGSLKKGHGKSGRNSTGRITTRHKIGPGRKNYRIVDFMRVKLERKPPYSYFRDMVVGVSFDPCRSALVAKVIGNSSNQYRLVLAATGMKAGSVFHTSRGPPPENHVFAPGDTFPLKHMPISSNVFNVETYPGSGGKMARCGDACFTIKSNSPKKGSVMVVLERGSRSVEIDGDCLATFGSALTNRLRYLPLGKAGRARRYGKGPGGKKGIVRLRNKRFRGRKNMPYLYR